MTLFLIALCLVFLSGDTHVLLKEFQNLKTSSKTIYEYDNNGHITKVWNKTGAETEFIYYSGLIIRKQRASNQEAFTIDSLFLNREGIVESIAAVSGGKAYMEYDKDNHLTKSTTYFNASISLTSEYIWSSGNLTTVTNKNERDNLISTNKYEYYDNTLNLIGNHQMGMPFMGLSSKSLIKKLTTVSSNGDTTVRFYEYRRSRNEKTLIKITKDINNSTLDSVVYIF
jgi:hypothetical protein